MNGRGHVRPRLKKRRKRSGPTQFVVAAAACLFPLTAIADPLDQSVDSTMIVHGILREPLRDLPGSAYLIDHEQLEMMRPLTMKEVLRRAPGVQIIDEDVLGLKLNISVRGLNPRRSGRTLLMEDGAPIQPAPYADPSAHYYPPIERIERIEFRRGSGQVLYGPQSIGGAINFITAAVPSEPETTLTLAGGEGDYRLVSLSAGLGDARFGTRLHLIEKQSDGIRLGHFSRAREAALKTRLALTGNQTLTLKASYAQEDTRLTEGGLSQARYDKNPYANPFQNDQFTLRRLALQALYDLDLSAKGTVSSQVYFSDTFRASYRQADTSIDSMVANPSTGCIGAKRLDYEGYAQFCGNKMRPRKFQFWGVETRLDHEIEIWGLDGNLTLGLRAHFEDTNRKRYNGLLANAREDTPGTLLRDDNDITTEAYSFYGQVPLSIGRWTATPGVRVEKIRTRNTALTANFAPLNRSVTQNQSLTLPGLGLTWSPSERITLFAGIHRGFAPPRPDRDYDPNLPPNAVRPERSVETEIGLRSNPLPGLGIEATLFDMHLDDLVVEGALVGGRSGTFVNAGRALHQGLELTTTLEKGPIKVSATYSNLATARFLTNAGESSANVKGNRLPYAPRNLFDLSFRYRVLAGLQAELGLNYVGDQFGNASNSVVSSADGQTGLVPARTLYRFAVNYALPNKGWSVFLSGQNLADTAYIASRVDGLFAGPRRKIVAGLKASW
jgi:Fe(3+) dicitrate transport protein